MLRDLGRSDGDGMLNANLFEKSSVLEEEKKSTHSSENFRYSQKWPINE
jgi:hypothetical protein